MKKFLSIFLAAAMALTLIGCGTQDQTEQPADDQPEQQAAWVEEAITYTSRGVEVSAVFTRPNDTANYPLVVLCHGHGGNKDENIGFPAVAHALAESGIASIRMDYPGCGESTEDFTQNVLSNMKEDTLNAVQYALENYPVQKDKVGIFGYSMGGRIALELLAEQSYDFQAAAFLAPAADTDDLKNLFGGAEAWDSMKATAQANGYADFTTIYGQQQKLSDQWFADLEAYPGNSVVAKAAEAYQGPALVIWAVDDEAVSPSVSANVAAALNANIVNTPEDGHSYGFYSEKTAVLNEVAYSTAAFFNAILNK